MYHFSFADIQHILKDTCRYEGDTTLVYDGFRPILECSRNHISWIRPNVKKAAYYLNNTQAGCIVCNDESFQLYTGNVAGILFIITPTPLLTLVKILKNAKEQSEDKTGPMIHATAIIHPDCKLGTGVKIGPYCILDACTIGDETVLGNNVRIHDNVVIGKKCVIKEFCSIGGDGFGMVKGEDGKNIHVPHVGGVSIGDRVTIFPYVTVNKGMLGDTIVESNATLDHYSYISHNSFVGDNTLMAGGTLLGGGTRIKNDCFIGLNTVIKEKVEIGAGATIGMGSAVTRNVPDNETWMGNPATELKAAIAQRDFLKKNIEASPQPSPKERGS